MSKQEIPKSETENKELEKLKSGDFVEHRKEGAFRKSWTITLSDAKD